LLPASLAALLLGGCASAVETAAIERMPSTYVVFFPKGDAALTPEAKAIIDRAATAIRATQPEQVVVAAGGHTRRSGGLSNPRAFAVRQALAQDGIADELLARSDLESINLAASDTAEQRVEIRLV